jgi:2-polyprenyl-3-methyl-5-hydroxy-6-metoxy-1,4-benzoquinol methylase
MPRRIGKFIPMETLPIEDRLKEPDRCQARWYELVSTWCKGQSVLDVGAGTGYGLDILQQAGAFPVCGIDPQPLRDYIISVPVDQVTSKSYDIVVSMDVIEHVEKDVEFLQHLLRVAKSEVFFSTPNWNISKAQNRYHVREYTPEELFLLIWPYRREFYTLDDKNSPVEILTPQQAGANFGVRLFKE